MAKCKRKRWSKIFSIVAQGKSLTGLIFFTLCLCAFVPLCLISCLSTAAMCASIPVGAIDLVDGAASVRHDSQPASARIQPGDKVYTRDEITTDSGARVKISFINHSSIHLGGGSHLIITSVLYAPQKSLNRSFFKLPVGKIRAVVEKFQSADSKFEVETKTAVAGVIGTEEIISAYEEPETGQDVTRVICQTGHLVIRSSDPKIAGEVFLESLEQSWIKENEAPEDKVKITLEELEEMVRETSIIIGGGEGKSLDKTPGPVKKEEEKKAGQSGESGKDAGSHGQQGGQPGGQQGRGGEQQELKDQGLKTKDSVPDIRGLGEQATPAEPRATEDAASLEQEKDIIGADSSIGGADRNNPDDGSGGLADDGGSGGLADDGIFRGLLRGDAVGDDIDIDIDVDAAGIGTGLTGFEADLSEDTILKDIIPDIEETRHETLEMLPAPPGPP